MGRRAKPQASFDRDLSDLPPALRRREYMMRVEAFIFAASRPVPRETLSALIGSDCNLDHLIADIRDELRTRAPMSWSRSPAAISTARARSMARSLPPPGSRRRRRSTSRRWNSWC
jgi:hypothetical protein